MATPKITFADKRTIPQIGLGLWKVKDAAEFNTAFNAAIEAGYRHFDSAQAYDNERMLGEAWKASSVKREELFLTTKIAIQNFGHKKAKKAFAESLQRLQTDHVDLLLLHFPVTLLRKSTWRALEEIHAEGGATSIGVSNFMIRHLEEMRSYAKVTPVVNQVESHVFLQQPELIKYCHDNNIVVEAYSPLAHAKPVIQQIAEKHGKSYAQIMLRWCIEQGFIVIPKSVTPSRVQENIDIFEFRLDDEDLGALKALDRGLRTCWSPVHVP